VFQSNSKAVGGPVNGFAFVPIRAVFLDGIVRAVETGSEAVRKPSPCPDGRAVLRPVPRDFPARPRKNSAPALMLKVLRAPMRASHIV